MRKSKVRVAKILSLAVGATGLLSSAAPVKAAATTWRQTGTDFNDGANWSAAINTGDIATFGNVAITQPQLTGNISLSQIVFNLGASGYNLTSLSPDFAITLTGTGTGTTAAISNQISSGTNTIAAGLILGAGPGTTQQFQNTAAGGTMTISGNISGGDATSNLLISANAAGITLSGCNTFTSNVTFTITGGTVSVADIGMVGAASNLGAGSTLTFTNKTILKYTGSGQTSNKQIILADTSGMTLDASTQTGALNLSGDISGNLTGSNFGTRIIDVTGNVNFTNELSGNITDGVAGANSNTSVQINAGNWTLSGTASTYTGNTIIKGGNLFLKNATALGASTVIVSTNGSLDNTSGGLLTLNNNPFLIGADLTFINTNDTNLGTGNFTLNATNKNIGVTQGNVTVGGNITGAFGFTKAGAGNLILAGSNNNYTNATAISAGTLTLTGTIAGTPSVTLTNGAQFNETSTGVLGGASTLVLTNGNASIAGANIYTGVTTVTAGTLNLSGSITGSNITLSGGAAQFSETSTGVIGGAPTNFTQTLGNTTLAGANTYGGTTTVSAGTLSLTGIGTLGATSANLTISSGTVNLGTTSQTVNVISMTNNGTISNGNIAMNALNVSGAGSTNALISAKIVGTGNLTKTGVGNLTLTQSNTYTGLTTLTTGNLSVVSGALGAGNFSLNGGTLVAAAGGATLTNAIQFNNGSTIGGNDALNLNGNFTRIGGATLTVNNTALTTIGGAVYLSDASAPGRTLTIQGTGNVTISGAISNFNGGGGNPGNLTYSGTGTLALSGTSNFTGTTSLTSGALNLSGNLGSIVSVTGGNFTQTSGSIISGTGTFTLNSATSTATLAGANTYSGNTTVTSGNLVLASNTTGVVTNGPVGTGTLSLGGGFLNASGDRSISNFFVITANSVINAGGNITFTGKYAQNATTGTTLTVNNISNFNGGIDIMPLFIAPAGRTMTLAGSGTLNINSTISNGNSTAGALTWQGNGTLNLGAANTYTGATILNFGTINMTTANSTLGNGTTAVTLGTATLNLGGFSKTTGAFTVTGASTVQGGNLTATSYSLQNATGTLTISANLAGAAATFNHTNGGTVLLSGNNTWGGTTTITGGTVMLGASNSLPTGTTLAVSATGPNATLDLNGNRSVTVGTVTNNGNIINSGSGTPTFTMGNGTSGSGNFTGGMNVVWNQGTSSSYTGNFTQIGSLTLNQLSGGTFLLVSNVFNSGNVSVVSGGTATTTITNLGNAGSFTHTGGNTGLVSITGNVTSSVTDVIQNSATSNLTISAATVAYTGATTVSAGSLRISGGTTSALATSAVSVTGSGNLSLVNTVGQSVNLGAGALTLGTAANTAVLNFELGNLTNYDQIITGATATTAGTIKFNLSTLTGFDTGNYTLLSAAGGLNSAAYTFNLISPGYTYTTSVSGTAVMLTVNNLNTSPNTVYWGGGQDFSWTTNNAGVTNWFTDSGNTTNLGGTPGAASTVVFSTTTAGTSTTGNLTTTLDGNYTIAAIAFSGNPTGAQVITINAGSPAGSRLTITGNTTGTGIDVQSTNANVTFGAGITVAGNQTWNIAGGKLLTASGTMLGTSGSSVLTKSGTGKILFGSTTQTYDQLVIAEGTVELPSSGGMTVGALGANGIVLGNSTLDSNSVTLQSGGGGSTILTSGTNILVQAGTTGNINLSQSNNGFTVNGNITLNNNLTLVNGAGGGDLTLNGRITGSNNLIVSVNTDTGHTDSVFVLGNSAATFAGNVTFAAVNGSGDALLFFNDGSLGNSTLNGGATQTITFSNNSGLIWNGTNTQDLSSRFVATSGTVVLGVSTLTNTVTLNDLDVSLAGSAAGIKKEGAGTLVLPDANTFSGGVTYGTRLTSLNGTNGTIAIGDDASLGSGTFTMSGSAGIRSMNNADHTITNAMGTIGSTGNTTATFGDVNNVGTGNLTFTNTTASAIGTGIRTFAVNNTTSLAGRLTGVNGNLTKTGAGTLILNGGGNYTGSTVVSTGKLIVNGSLTSNVTIASSAALGGTANFLRTVTATDNTSVISPGNSPGDMTIGNVTATNGATLKFEIGSTDGVGISDHLIITNAFAAPTSGAGGLVMDINAWGFDPAGPKTGTVYTLVTFTSQTGLDANDFTAIVGPGLVLDNSLTFDTDGVQDGIRLNSNSIQIQFSSVPEPTSLSVLGLGVGGLLARRRRRRAAKVG